MAKKLFFLDLDGTLLNDEKKISAVNKKAIEKAVGLGHKVIVTTGRALSSVIHLLPEFGLDKSGCYAITYNGGLIYDVGAKEAIYKKTMPLDQVADVFEKAYAYGKIHIQTYTDDYFLCEKDTPESIYYEQKAGCERKIVKNVLEEFNGSEPCKMLAIAYAFDRKRLEGFREYVKEWADGKMEVYFSCNEYLEFMPLGIDKGAAVLWLAQYLGVNAEDTIAVGDAENDISMIQAAGIGVVMKNASDDMKAYGDYITEKDNNEGGVAEVIEKYIAE